MAILLTNDDGVEAAGLYDLAESLRDLDDILIVAPDTEQSGVGHSITLRKSIEIKQLSSRPSGVQRIQVGGTPADAVKFALRHYLDDLPSLVVSGPNTGPNVGINVLYSGTVAACFEANFWGVSALAISSDLQKNTYDFTACCHYARLLVKQTLVWEAERRQRPDSNLRHGRDRPFLLNVNVPALSLKMIKGLKITRHGTSGFNEFFIPHGKSGSIPGHFTIDGNFEENDPDDGYDAIALVQGYVSVSPLSYNLTDKSMLGDKRLAECEEL